jgi:hypothetical protein
MRRSILACCRARREDSFRLDATRRWHSTAFAGHAGHCAAGGGGRGSEGGRACSLGRTGSDHGPCKARDM